MAKLCGVLSAILVDDMVKVWWRKGSQTMKEEFHSMGVRFLHPPGAGGQPVFDTPYVMSKPQWWLYGDGACRTKECLLLCAFSNYGLSKNCKMEAVLFKPWSRFLCTEATYMSKAKAVNSPMVMNKVVQRNRSERLTCFLLYISRCYVPCTQQVIAHTCGRHFAMCGEKFSSRENSVALLKVTSSFLDFFFQKLPI